MSDSGAPAEKPGMSNFQKAKRAWRIYSWGRRILSAPDWFNWAWAAFQTKAGVAAVAGTVAAGAVGTVAVVAPELLPWPKRDEPPAAVVIVEPPPLPPMPPLAPELQPVAMPQKLAGDSTVFTITGADAGGREATFELLLLSRSISWTRRSSSTISRDGQELTEEQVTREVLGGEVQRRLAASIEIIAAGASSAEGSEATETERAAERAVTTATWVGLVAPDKQVSTLNLGQYQARCAAEGQAADTSWQRPLLIIGVVSKAEGVQLDQALSNAMSGKTNLPSPTCYSRFDLKRTN